ncbi:uncharacterized protein [Clytia hemisphaerica]|uniref:P2X purinoreceptor 7 intracellular domain-containing protein n=1 Tax=Clytia hemisphaerica TaxID=252671 RepID=A0A7M5XNV0_9CNID
METVSNGKRFCKCKSMCSKKEGKTWKGGCPCKTRGENCNELCQCGVWRKKELVAGCKNGGPTMTQNTVRTTKTINLNQQAGDANSNQTVQNRSDGFILMEEELEIAERKIRAFLDSLSREDLMEMLIVANNHGNGSLQALKDNLAEAKDETPEPEPGEPVILAPSWCKCGKCKEMPALIENKCCMRKHCVSKLTKFNKYCLDEDLLVLNIKARCDIRADVWNFETRELRKAAYRQFTLWKYGRLGNNNRRVVPSCCVLKVRSEFPSPNGIYLGYKPN